MVAAINYKRPESNYEYVDIPAGTYEATCVGHYPRPKVWKDEPAVPGVVFKYVIDLGEELGAVEMKRHLALATGPRATLRKDMIAIHGEDAWVAGLVNDGKFNELIDATIDQPVLLQIERRVSKNGKDFCNIVAVMPPMKSKQPGATLVKRQVQEYVPPTKNPVSQSSSTHYSFKGVPEGIAQHAQKFLAEQGATYDSGLERWISPTRFEKLREYEIAKSAGSIRQTPIAEDDIPF